MNTIQISEEINSDIIQKKVNSKKTFIKYINIHSGEITEFGCAKTVYEMYKDEFIYVEDKGWYQYKDNKWNPKKECMKLKLYISSLSVFTEEEVKRILNEDISIEENKMRDIEDNYMNENKENSIELLEDVKRKIKELYKKRTTLQQAQIQLNNVSFKNNVIAICKELFLDVNEIINCKNQYSDKVLQNTYINKDQMYDNIEKEIVKIKWIKSNIKYKRVSQIINDFHLSKSILLSKKLKEYFIQNGVIVEEDKKNGHKIYIEYY